MTQKEVFARNDVHIFQYSTNLGGVKIMEFGALFLLVIAVLIYPFTHFDPKIWMAAPVVLAVGSVVLMTQAVRWHKYAHNAFVAYDDVYLMIGNNPERVACIPWELLDVHNTGLDQPGAGANLEIRVEGEVIPLRLFTAMVCIPKFETLMCTMLQHIQENQKNRPNGDAK